MRPTKPIIAAVAVIAAWGVLSGCSGPDGKQEKRAMKKPIIDRLDNCAKYAHLHPEFEKAFEFLRQDNIAQLELARHAVNGEKVYCSLSKGPGRKREQALLEAHRKHIDIQYVISGSEEMGYRSLAECRQEKEAYNPAKDVVFYGDSPDRWIKVPAGSFVIFFPDDAHAPLISDNEIHKAVVKVEVAGRITSP